MKSDIFSNALFLLLGMSSGFAITHGTTAQTTDLGAGDIVITGFNFDGTDDFTFLLLRDVEEDTEIIFTDNGVRSDGTFRANEGTQTYVFSGFTSAGTVIGVTDSGLAFSGGGDQVIAYQEDGSTTNFIYAVNSEGSSFQSNATSSNTSALPPGLTVGGSSPSAVAINEVDNAFFDVFAYNTDSMSDLTPDGWRAAVGNQDNWTGRSNTSTNPVQSGTVNVVPSPTAGFGALCLMGLTAARRRRRPVKKPAVVG